MVHVSPSKRFFHPLFWVFSVLVGVTYLSCAGVASADNMYRTAPQTVSLFTEAIPTNLQVNARLSGLSVVGIEHLSAFRANIVHVQLGEDHSPAGAVRIFNTAFPGAHFELFEVLDTEEVAAKFVLN